MTPFSANSTCQVVAHAEAEQPASGTAVHLLFRRMRDLFREPHGTPVQLQPVQLLPPIAGACVGHGGCCFLVTGLSLYLYQGAYIAFPASESFLLTCLLVAYTHQAIVVLLPKLTNAPTKLHTGCIALWDSGVYIAIIM